MSTSERTALGRDAVQEQVKAWVAEGKPEGLLTLRGFPLDRAQLQVHEPALVVAWASFFGGQPVIFINNGAAVATSVYPKALPGWRFTVWCQAPNVATNEHIEVLEVES